MNQPGTYPELQRRIATLGTRITTIKHRVQSEPDAGKIADASRLQMLEERQRILADKLAELGRGGFGLLQRVKEEIAVIEDDLTSFMDHFVE